MSAVTASSLGLIGCAECGLVSRAPEHASPRCSRCGATLLTRSRDPIARTLALLAAATICYIPAMVLPVLVTTAPGGVEADTILDGVQALQRSGSWALALIVLVASVMIPIGKIGALAYLCTVAQRRMPADLRECGRLLRILEIVGRWSMLDVFVDAFVVALVQMPPLMFVQPGPGVAFFAATAVFTMLAAMAFDPRALWKRHE